MVERFMELALMAVCIVYGLFLNKQLTVITYARNIRDDPKFKATPTVIKIANENIAKAKKKGIYSTIAMCVILLILGFVNYVIL